MKRRFTHVFCQAGVRNYSLAGMRKQTPWSVKIAKGKVTFFGHVCCLPETIPVKITQLEALRPSKNPKRNTKIHTNTIKGETQ